MDKSSIDVLDAFFDAQEAKSKRGKTPPPFLESLKESSLSLRAESEFNDSHRSKASNLKNTPYNQNRQKKKNMSQK